MDSYPRNSSQWEPFAPVEEETLQKNVFKEPAAIDREGKSTLERMYTARDVQYEESPALSPMMSSEMEEQEQITAFELMGISHEVFYRAISFEQLRCCLRAYAWYARYVIYRVALQA